MDKKSFKRKLRNFLRPISYFFHAQPWQGNNLEALLFATNAHAGQERKYTGKPYITHCAAVAELVSAETGDSVLYAAALLHDVLEDTDVTYDQLAWKFGDRIADIVLELTDVFTHEDFPDWNRSIRKRAEAKRLHDVSDDAKLIKTCDVADNTSDIVQYDPTFAKVYLAEKAYLLEQLGH